MGISAEQRAKKLLRVTAFVDAKMRGLSNRDAAIASGCSPRTAASAGSRLAASKDVTEEIFRRGKALTQACTPATSDDDSNGVIAEPVGLSDAVLAAGQVKWVDGTSFLLAVVNAPLADLKIRVDAAFKLERVKAGFGSGKSQQPGLFENPEGVGSAQNAGSDAVAWKGLLSPAIVH